MTSTPSDALVGLDASGNGELRHVNCDPVTAGYIVPGSPEARAIRRRWILLNVGVFDHASGVRTTLLVPMWYDSNTTYVPPDGRPTPATLSEAVKDPDFAWDLAGTTDVKFHLEDGVFLLDEVSRPAGNSSDLNR